MVLRRASLFAPFVLIASVLLAQGWWDAKPYSTWSREDVDKMLGDSPWGQEVRRSIPRITLINPGIAGIERVYDRLIFHIGLLTAKPIRMALARRAMLLDPAGEARTDRGKYVDEEDPRNIVVIVHFSVMPVDSHIAVVVSQLLEQFRTSDLASQVTLEAGGGKKVRLSEYNPMGEDGYGYKFLFPRSLPDGRALVEPGDKELKFDLNIPIPREESGLRSVVVNAKWDLRKMQYQGRLAF